MSNLQQLLERADEIASHGPNIAYPSRSSSQRLRDLIRDLAAALRRKIGKEMVQDLLQWHLDQAKEHKRGEMMSMAESVQGEAFHKEAAQRLKKLLGEK
jgi:hypothetical protein